MPGPAPKPNAARRNKRPSSATLSRVHDVQAPSLPERLERPWHTQTLEWWEDIWASPMATQWERADIHGLYLLANLWDAAWYASTPSAQASIMAEVRLQRRDYGLTPLDRLRLDWTIEQVDEARDKGNRRRAAPKEKQASPKPGDELAALRAV